MSIAVLLYMKWNTLKGKDTPDDPHQNELEQDDSVQTSQVHHSGANGDDDYADDGEFIYPRSVTQESW